MTSFRRLCGTISNLNTNKAITLTKYLFYRAQGKPIIAHHYATIVGLKNIHIKRHLYVGTTNIGFSHPKDRTYLNIRGSLTIEDTFSIGRGCRVDIGPDAKCVWGSGYINPFTRLIIMHGLKIGRGVSISWNCEFLDDDFHSIDYEGKPQKENRIEIGDHVWIGSGVTILKGVRIGNNNVIASHAVVTTSFLDEHVLIGGNPAKIIKKDISWT